MRVIDADVLHDELMKLEDFTRKEIFKHERSGAEYWMRMGELNQITKLKHLVFDAPTVEAKPEWIPCSERLPINEQEVLVCNTNGNIELDTFYEGEFEASDFYGEEVISWMPLPEPYNADVRGGKNE